MVGQRLRADPRLGGTLHLAQLGLAQHGRRRFHIIGADHTPAHQQGKCHGEQQGFDAHHSPASGKAAGAGASGGRVRFSRALAQSPILRLMT